MSFVQLDILEIQIKVNAVEQSFCRSLVVHGLFFALLSVRIFTLLVPLVAYYDE